MKGITVNQKAIAIAIISLVACVIVGSVVLEFVGIDSGRIWSNALIIIPILITQLYLGKTNTAQNNEIKSAVNGNLDKKLEAIKHHVSAENIKTRIYVDSKVKTLVNK